MLIIHRRHLPLSSQSGPSSASGLPTISLRCLLTLRYNSRMMNLLTSPPCNSPCVRRYCPTMACRLLAAHPIRLTQLCYSRASQSSRNSTELRTPRSATHCSMRSFSQSTTIFDRQTAWLDKHDDVLVSCRRHPKALPAAILSTVQQLRSLLISETSCRFRIFGVHTEHNPFL